jgi:hypothetical protein
MGEGKEEGAKELARAVGGEATGARMTGRRGGRSQRALKWRNGSCVTRGQKEVMLKSTEMSCAVARGKDTSSDASAT